MFLGEPDSTDRIFFGILERFPAIVLLYLYEHGRTNLTIFEVLETVPSLESTSEHFIQFFMASSAES